MQSHQHTHGSCATQASRATQQLVLRQCAHSLSKGVGMQACGIAVVLSLLPPVLPVLLPSVLAPLPSPSAVPPTSPWVAAPLSSMPPTLPPPLPPPWGSSRPIVPVT